MSDKLILVDENDNIIGYKEKWDCHKGNGLRHRAFSIFIFNSKKQLLLQKRSRYKKLWPDYWANSCCSHPRETESRIEAGQRRLIEELGFTCRLKELFKYKYKAKFRNIGSENEFNAVLVGRYDGKIRANPDEIAELKWVNLNWLKKDIKENREEYAPWFVIAFRKFLRF